MVMIIMPDLSYKNDMQVLKTAISFSIFQNSFKNFN
jgi:hypothetical protein